MSTEIGYVQKRILEILSNIDSRWCSAKDFDQRWVSLNLIILAVYDKPLNIGARWGREYTPNQHRRVWESCRTLEKRKMVQVRKESIKGSGLRARLGGIQYWLEVRRV